MAKRNQRRPPGSGGIEDERIDFTGAETASQRGSDQCSTSLPRGQGPDSSQSASQNVAVSKVQGCESQPQAAGPQRRRPEPTYLDPSWRIRLPSLGDHVGLPDQPSYLTDTRPALRRSQDSRSLRQPEPRSREPGYRQTSRRASHAGHRRGSHEQRQATVPSRNAAARNRSRSPQRSPVQSSEAKDRQNPLSPPIKREGAGDVESDIGKMLRLERENEALRAEMAFLKERMKLSEQFLADIHSRVLQHKEELHAKDMERADLSFLKSSADHTT